MAVADVRSDGTVYVYTHTSNPQALRSGIAHMLSTSVDHVVVRTFPGPGHHGRSNGGNAGAEDEAVILSQAVGKPVRVQWMRHDDPSGPRSGRRPIRMSRSALMLKGK
jgi:nicotinate dehydrogenase subunit B